MLEDDRESSILFDERFVVFKLLNILLKPLVPSSRSRIDLYPTDVRKFPLNDSFLFTVPSLQ